MVLVNKNLLGPEVRWIAGSDGHEPEGLKATG